jgi:hypothetical protein
MVSSLACIVSLARLPGRCNRAAASARPSKR